MSFYDDASLVFLPSGQAGKDGKAYSMKPTNGDGDFTFSRGSNLTATRVDSNGLIEKGRENLLLQSNQFDTTWIESNASATNGQSGYDGSMDAWLLSKSAASGRIYQNVSVSGVATYSIYAKADSINWILIYTGGGSNPRGYFDLVNGVIGTNNNLIDYNIEPIGTDGWYRISITHDTTISNVRIFPADGDDDLSGTSGSIYIQDAQIEQGLVATEYIESGATKGKAGILEHSPRFDYSGGASCPSLLLEPSRTNNIPYSEYFEYIGWAKTRCTITDNYAISPEGFQNAALMTATGDDARLEEVITLSGDYTQSIWIKSGQSGDVEGQIDFAGIAAVTFTANQEWQRVETTANTAHRVRVRITNSGDKLFVYGAQLEEGSYATSYIPNHSGGSVTRDADSAEVTSASSIIGQTEGTIFLEFKADNVSLDIIGINRSTTNGILIFKTASNLVKVQIYSGGSSTTLTNTGVLSGVIKLALVYKSRESSLFINGTKVATSTNNLSFTASLNLVEFMGNYFAGIGKNEVQQTLLFPTALSDNNCITLTS